MSCKYPLVYNPYELLAQGCFLYPVEPIVKSDEEYACLMNCLEGYYLYDGDSKEDGEEVEYDDEDDDTTVLRSISIKN